MSEIVEIELDKIVPNKDNDKIFSMSEIQLLAQTIKEEGFYGGIEVFKIPHKDQYEISSGHRRYEAVKLLGKKTIPCIVSKYPSDFKRGVKMLVSNIRSRKLSPLEMAKAIDYYSKLLKNEGFKGEMNKKIAEFFNMSEIQVYRHQCLLRLIPELQELADDPQFPYSAFREAATLSKDGQKELYKDIIYFLNAQAEDDKEYALTRPRIEQLIGNIKAKEVRRKEIKARANIQKDSAIDYKPLNTEPEPESNLVISPAFVSNVNDGYQFKTYDNQDEYHDAEYEAELSSDESPDETDAFTEKMNELKLLKISESISELEGEINTLPEKTKHEAVKLLEKMLAWLKSSSN